MITNKVKTELFKKCCEYTETNSHGKALELIADKLGFKQLKKLFKHINEIHSIEGYMPISLLTYRNELSNTLFKSIREKYGDEFYKQLLNNL